MFNGKRLSLARKRRGLTKKGFAEAMSLHPRTVLRWEEGERVPTDEELGKISLLLGFPEKFFCGDDLDEANETNASFRSLSTMSARDRDAALAAGAIGFMLGDWIEDTYALPDHELEDFPHETPEGAARALREKWGIGERPIKDMVRILEAKGVRVFSLAENTNTVDAFSVWRNNKPYVFLNCNKSAEHQRFDAAHELGHLVLHKHGGPQGRQAEDDANMFASSFLMPRGDLVASVPIVYCLEDMITAKGRWRVSLAALNYRLHKIGVLSDWQYRSFCIQIQERGYRKNEPQGIAREFSTVWQQVFDDLRRNRVTKTAIAAALDLPPAEIENLVFGLAHMMSIEGGGAGDGHRRGKVELVSDNNA